jgi:hypothetical protein
MKLRRRDFITAATLGTAGTIVGCSQPQEPAKSAAAAGPTGNTFDVVILFSGLLALAAKNSYSAAEILFVDGMIEPLRTPHIAVLRARLANLDAAPDEPDDMDPTMGRWRLDKTQVKLVVTGGPGSLTPAMPWEGNCPEDGDPAGRDARWQDLRFVAKLKDALDGTATAKKACVSDGDLSAQPVVTRIPLSVGTLSAARPRWAPARTVISGWHGKTLPKTAKTDLIRLTIKGVTGLEVQLTPYKNLTSVHKLPIKAGPGETVALLMENLVDPAVMTHPTKPLHFRALYELVDGKVPAWNSRPYPDPIEDCKSGSKFDFPVYCPDGELELP